VIGNCRVPDIADAMAGLQLGQLYHDCMLEWPWIKYTDTVVVNWNVILTCEPWRRCM
jgi:hypothetical protein